MTASACLIAALLVANAAAAPSPPDAGSPATKDAGADLDPGMVARYVKSRLRDVKVCYETELKKNPKLSGQFFIHWTIDGAGATRNIYLVSNTMPDAKVADCVMALVPAWRFPAPTGGSVDVKFPFVFRANAK
jgi:hypothetical protein